MTDRTYWLDLFTGASRQEFLGASAQISGLCEIGEGWHHH